MAKLRFHVSKLRCLGWISPILFLASSCSSIPVGHVPANDVNFTVAPEHIVRREADRAVGINLNYIRDADANRPAHTRPLRVALRDLGVRWLRYPGGEKSDFHLWSQPPYNRAKSTSFGNYTKFPGQRIDFDKFIAIARETRAEPFVVVGFDSEKRTGRTRAEWLRDAVEWVRYANVKRGYGVKYWEIGNENWNHETATPQEMAGIVAEFSTAMKRVDPSIQIGASGSGAKWWAGFLPKASRHLDFITLSLYTTGGWPGFSYWAQHPNVDLIYEARLALESIDRFAAPADRRRLQLVVTETNAIDWLKGGWNGRNTLGRSLVIFDQIGRLLSEPRIRATMLWGTRWMNDADAQRDVSYALSRRNEILPTGQALALWGQFIQSDLIQVTGGNAGVSAFASRSRDGKTVVVWVLNRSLADVPSVSISISGKSVFRTAMGYQWTGKGPNDLRPLLKEVVTPDVKENRLEAFPIPATSISVIEFSERPTRQATPSATKPSTSS